MADTQLESWQLLGKTLDRNQEIFKTQEIYEKWLDDHFAKFRNVNLPFINFVLTNDFEKMDYLWRKYGFAIEFVTVGEIRITLEKLSVRIPEYLHGIEYLDALLEDTIDYNHNADDYEIPGAIPFILFMFGSYEMTKKILDWMKLLVEKISNGTTPGKFIPELRNGMELVFYETEVHFTDADGEPDSETEKYCYGDLDNCIKSLDQQYNYKLYDLYSEIVNTSTILKQNDTSAEQLTLKEFRERVNEFQNIYL